MTDHNARQAGLTDEQRKRAFDVWLDAERKRREFGVNIEEQRGFCSGFAAACALYERLAAHSADALSAIPNPYKGKDDAAAHAYDCAMADAHRVVRASSARADARNGEGVALTDEMRSVLSGAKRELTLWMRSHGKDLNTQEVIERIRAMLDQPRGIAAPAAPAPHNWNAVGELGKDARRKRAEWAESLKPSAPEPAAQADRDASQLCDWLLTDPQSGKRLRFAGPLESDFLRMSRVRMESADGSVWTLTAGLKEGYLTASERLANIRSAAMEEGKQSSTPADAASEADKDRARIDYLASIGPHQMREIALLAENECCGDLRAAIDIQRERQQGADRG